MVRSNVIDDLEPEVFDSTTDGTVVPLPDRATLPPVQAVSADLAPTGPRQHRKPATTPTRTNTTKTDGGAGADSDDSDDTVSGFGGVDVSDLAVQQPQLAVGGQRGVGTGWLTDRFGTRRMIIASSGESDIRLSCSLVLGPYSPWLRTTPIPEPEQESDA